MSDLVINEFMASNDSTVTDTAGDFDDWIELYNKGNAPIDLTGYYLSDKTDNPLKWQIDTTFVLQADSYLIIWADENGSQGPFHANFKLSAAGENIYLSDSTGMLLDSVSFGPQTTDISMARKPNGTGNFVMSDPTFNASNNVTSREPEIAEEDFLVYPNPAQSLLRIQIDAAELRDELYIYNTMGQLIMTKEINSTELNIETSSWAEGLYIFQYKGLSRRIFVSPL
ncbi:MAG: lamin tail domain-containing protein [Bacteroidota bacterium]